MPKFPQPTLPPETIWTDAEQTFRDEEPRRLFPENQDSNWGLLRHIFSVVMDDIHQKLHLIYTEMFPQTSVTWLDEWEYMVGLPRNPANKTLEQRRAAVIARLNAGPWTRQKRYDLIDSFIRPTFGEAIKLLPPGVELVVDGVPIFNDTPEGDYFIVKEIVGTYYYEIQIIDTLFGLDEIGLGAALDYIQYGGLHHFIRYVPSISAVANPPIDPGL